MGLRPQNWIQKNLVSLFLSVFPFHKKKLLISPFPYLLNLVALHQSIVAQHRPKNNDDDDNDNADDGDEDGNGDGDDSDAHQSAVAEPRLNNK